MSLPILYSFRRCPYAMRARLALAAGQIHVELREIVFRNKPAEMLEASPKGTVPVLILPDGVILEESLDIIKWSLRTSPAGKLLKPENATIQTAIQLIEQMDRDFKPHLDHYKYPNRFDGIDPMQARSKAAAFMKALNEMLSHHAYLYGPHRCVADIGIAPFVRQFAHVNQTWFYDQDWKPLIQWLDAFKGSDNFKQIMVKYPAWKPDDDPTVFPAPL